MESSKIIGRPQKYKPGTRTTINIPLWVETAEALRAKARETGLTIGDILTEMASKHLHEIEAPGGE